MSEILKKIETSSQQDGKDFHQKKIDQEERLKQAHAKLQEEHQKHDAEIKHVGEIIQTTYGGDGADNSSDSDSSDTESLHAGKTIQTTHETRYDENGYGPFSKQEFIDYYKGTKEWEAAGAQTASSPLPSPEKRHNTYEAGQVPDGKGGWKNPQMEPCAVHNVLIHGVQYRPKHAHMQNDLQCTC